MPENALKLITFVKGGPDFSCKSTTAANVDLTEFFLDNWLKNNNITVVCRHLSWIFQLEDRRCTARIILGPKLILAELLGPDSVNQIVSH